MKSRRLDYLTAAEAESFLRRSDAAILPIGPTEAHGVHCPLGCDLLVALGVAELTAPRADAVILPPFSYSWPGATSSLPGTIAIPLELVMQVLTAIARGALAKGFRRLALVSYHGPDSATVGMTARRLFEEIGAPVAAYHVLSSRQTPRLREIAEELRARDQADPGLSETTILAAALRVLGLEQAAALRMDLPALTPVAMPASRARATRTGANVGYYYTDLSQHIPKPQAVPIELGMAYLEASADALADALDGLRDYLTDAPAIHAKGPYHG